MTATRRISRRELRRCLLGTAQQKNANRAMRILSELIENAEQEQFLLATHGHVSDDEIAEAFLRSLNDMPRSIIRISLTTGPIPKPDHLSLHLHRRMQSIWLAEDVDRLISYRLMDRHHRHLQERCSSMVGLEKDFQDLLGTRLRGGLRNGVRSTECYTKQWEDAWRQAYRTVRTAIVCYLAYANLNDEPGMTRMESLVRILHRAIPLGSMKFGFCHKIVLVR